MAKAKQETQQMRAMNLCGRLRIVSILLKKKTRRAVPDRVGQVALRYTA